MRPAVAQRNGAGQQAVAAGRIGSSYNRVIDRILRGRSPKMANYEDLARIRQGAAVWNGWRARNPERPIDLSGAKLSESLRWQMNLHMAIIRRVINPHTAIDRVILPWEISITPLPRATQGRTAAPDELNLGSCHGTLSCRLRKPKDAGQPPAPCAVASRQRSALFDWQRVVPQRLGNERVDRAQTQGLCWQRWRVARNDQVGRKWKARMDRRGGPLYQPSFNSAPCPCS
jgi:hypothetical protein